MPLRDHFHAPVSDRHSWDEIHGMWPGQIVRDLFPLLPAGFEAKPQVHPGTVSEIDVGTFDGTFADIDAADASDGGGVGTAILTALEPTLTAEAELDEYDDYAVRIYDVRYERRLVASIEIVSPSNKDRPASRLDFATKTAALLAKGVSVSIVDLVTDKHFNLYAELLDLIGQADPRLPRPRPAVYAVTLRARRPRAAKPLLDAWYYPMEVGRELPTIPLWLVGDRGVLLPLEAGYQEACRFLHIR